MNALTLKMEPRPRRATSRARAALRAAVRAVCAAGPLDSIREPAGLQVPLGERSRRLMRQARVAGW